MYPLSLQGLSPIRLFPTSDTSHKSWAIHTFDQLSVNYNHSPLLRFYNCLVWLTEPRKALYVSLPVHYKEYNPGTARWKISIGVTEGAYRAFRLSSGTPPSQHLDVFTNLEVHHISLFRFFFKDFTYLFDRAQAGEEAEGEGEADSPLNRESDAGLDPRTLRS